MKKGGPNLGGLEAPAEGVRREGIKQRLQFKMISIYIYIYRESGWSWGLGFGFPNI